MKLKLQKNQLLEKLTLSSHFISSRLSTTALLQGINLKGKKGEIHIFATNLSSYYHSKIKSQNDDEFNIVIEPRKVIEFISLLPSENLDLEIKKTSLQISQDKILGEFPILPPEEYPIFPKIEEKAQEIPAKFLSERLPLVLFSASSDDSRPILTGINFITQDEDLTVVSTDGFRLSLLKLKKEIEIPSVIVPAPFLENLISLLPGEGGIKMRYSHTEKTLGFYVEEDELYTRLIEGDYPPFEKVIPTEKKTTVHLEKEDLLRNVKLVAIFAREFSNIVILHASKTGIHIKPKTEKTGENVTFQEADVEGEEMQVAFNYKFLLDFLLNIKADKITIELLRKDAPVVFRSDKQPHFFHIIMPVRIQDD